MENINPKEEILKIEEDLSISGKGMAKMMEVNLFVYRNKKSDKSLGHSFNEENYKKVALYLIEYAEKLKIRLQEQGLFE